MAKKTAPPAAQIEVRSIDEFHLDPANVRRRDEETERMLEASLTTFKPFRSIAVDGDGITRAGNGTLKAARAAGVTEVLVVRPDPGQLVAVERTDLSPTQLAAYSIADNHLTDRSTDDEVALAKLLRDLRSEDVDLMPVGYTGDEVDKLLGDLADAMLVNHPIQPPPKMAWVLIGIPILKYAEIAEQIETMAGNPDVLCESTFGNEQEN